MCPKRGRDLAPALRRPPSMASGLLEERGAGAGLRSRVGVGRCAAATLAGLLRGRLACDRPTSPRELSVHEQVSSPSKALRTAQLVILTADLAIAAACLPPGAVQSGLFQGWTPAILSLIPSRQDECARSSAAKAPHTEASHTRRHHCRLAACPALWWPQGAKGGQRYYRHR